MQGAEHHVTGQCGVDGDFAGFLVTNFTDHDDVGRLAQHGSQRLGEGHADLVADLDLVDTAKFIFHRVLGRDDLDRRAVDGIKKGIKRRGFSGTGGTGDQEDAVGHADDALDKLLVVGEKPQFGDAKLDVGFVKNTHDYGFAVNGRKAGNTQVDVFSHRLHLNAAVLRSPVF